MNRNYILLFPFSKKIEKYIHKQNLKEGKEDNAFRSVKLMFLHFRQNTKSTYFTIFHLFQGDLKESL